MAQTVTANILAPMTELEAVNSMLQVIGEDALTTLDDASIPVEGSMAIAILRSLTRELQVDRWKFNTEFGYCLKPTVTSPFTWTNPDGTTRTINVFKMPTRLDAAGNVVYCSSFDVADSASQNQRNVDVQVRTSVQYTEAAVHVAVLYDRSGNADGLDAATYPYLFINPAWMLGFADCPESFRSYVVLVASRRLAARALGSTELAGLTEEDQKRAFNNLYADQEEDDAYSIFDNYDVRGGLGIRPLAPSGVYDPRSHSGNPSIL